MAEASESNQSENHSEKLHRIRHSLAHILAQAVLRLRPGSKLGFGPAIDDGLYYDFILSSPLSESDFPALEAEMKKIIKERQEFSFFDLSLPEAYAKLEEMGEPYKKEYAQELASNKGLKNLRFYQNGPFIDMCEGPHLNNTREVPKACFKLRSIAGAYWRGDSRNTMMTRIYVWAYLDKEQLNQKVKQWKLSQERDHKKLGKELDLFVIDEEIGKGLPLWLPNGTVVRDEIESYLKELEFREGFHRVATPHINKVELFYKTGHLPYYKEHIYPFMEFQTSDESEGTKVSYCLKPMNCPHHHRIFSHKKRSYRELPLRLAEYGQVYRYEDAGSLSGLLRVRGMCMNDGHIYCTPEQIRSEFLMVMEMHKELYQTLGLSDYYMRFSTWDPNDPKGREKFVDDPKAWQESQNHILEAMKESGLPYREGKGEAAFYGPKIDFQLKTVTGREETASTNQLDFAVPARLNMTYVNSENREVHPWVIHRAPAGTHERFVAFLIEHFGGAFPTWLAPVQAMLIPISDKFLPYAQKVAQELRAHKVRAEIDLNEASFNKKIRINTKAKIPNLLIIGEKEVEASKLTLRRYGRKEQSSLKVEEFVDWVKKQIATRALPQYDSEQST